MPITDYVGIVKVSGQEYLTGSTLFGICTNAATDTVKVVKIESITTFTPTHGLTIHVLFINSNTASNPTIKFSEENAATAYPIYQFGTTKVGNSISTSWRAGAIVSFTFIDGELEDPATEKRWVINSGIDTGADGLASVSLDNVQNADDIKAIEALTSTGYLKRTGDKTWALQTLNVSGGSASKTLTGITENGGNIQGTFADISITKSQVNDLFPANAGTTKYLREDGTWEVPPDTHTSITPGDGLVNGATTSTSQAAITTSGTISIKKGGVTNDMLAGSIPNTKLAHSSMSIAGSNVSLGETLTKDTLISALGIGTAVHYIGNSSTAVTNDGTENPTIDGGEVSTLEAGDVVLYGNQEYIWTTAGKWELFGDQGSYALKTQAVTDIAWDSNKLTKTINNSTSDVVTINTIKTALALGKSDVGLGNVDNDANLNKTTGTKGDIIYWSANDTPARLSIGTNGQVLKVNSSGVPVWTTDNSSDPKVTQNIIGTSDENNYPLLLSYYKKDVTTVTKQTVNRVQAIYVQPSTGTLYATKFSGDGSGLTGITTDHIAGTGNGTKYLRQDGWKTVSVSVTTNNSSGQVLTGFTYSAGTLPKFTQGTKASASVANGILTIINQTDDTFTQGAITTITNITKADLDISGS